MLHEDHGAEGVDLVAEKGIVIFDLVGRFLWEQDARDAEAEVEVVFFDWEELGGLLFGVGDGLLV